MDDVVDAVVIEVVAGMAVVVLPVLAVVVVAIVVAGLMLHTREKLPVPAGVVPVWW